MPNRASARPASVAALLAGFRAGESGAIRTDMIAGGLAVIAVLGILIMSDMNSADPAMGDGTGEAAAAAPARTYSSVGFRAPQPQAPAEGASRRSYASDGYGERFASTPDKERALLEAQSELARAAEAAAGGPPPVAEAPAETAAIPETATADEAVATDETANEASAEDGG
jgi:hypothetical protein